MGRALTIGIAVVLLPGCRADVWVESPDERIAERPDSVAVGDAPIDTVFRSVRVDSAGASFAWLVERPPAHLPASRPFPDDAADAVRQYLRALAQTGSSDRGAIGVGDDGYERAFTYVHPRVRRGRSATSWSAELAGIVRPILVRLEPVPGDTTRVFVELLVLRDVDGVSMLGLYYGHMRAAPGDNGWQVTGARLASEDWQSPLGEIDAWRYDRGRAATGFAAEDAAFSQNLVRLESGEWVPLARPAPSADLTLGLPDLR